ncbi:MAG: rod shape-determining protein MreC, partial [Elusimicrobia bacterium]|nr:rod shape-determining protein MreC [Elusimicrobiota bacterium]
MKSKPAIVFVLLFSVSLLFIVFDLTEKVTFIRNFIKYLIKPAPGIALNIIDTGERIGGNVVSLVKVFEENRALVKENVRLKIIEEQNRILVRQNNELRDILNLPKRQGFNLVAARVVARDPVQWFKSVAINKGFNDGIVSGSPVLCCHTGRISLVGRVVEADAAGSTILLLTDSLSGVSVKVVRSGEMGVIMGQNSPEFILDYILPDGDIRLGDEVVTGGIGGVFPEGLPVGVVTDVHGRGKGRFRQATVKPVAGWNSLHTLVVMA